MAEWLGLTLIFFMAGITQGVTGFGAGLVAMPLLSLLLGLLLVGYGAFRLLFTVRPRGVHRGWAYVAGFAAGAISGAFSAGGPPTIIYTTLTGWNKDEIKATLSGFFFISGVLIAVGHGASGLTTVTVLRFFAATAPAVLIGVAIGAFCSRRFSTEGYIKLILVCLVLLGLLMVGRFFFTLVIS